MAKKKKNSASGQFVVIFIFVVMGFIIGGFLSNSVTMSDSIGIRGLQTLLKLVLLYVAMVIQIILHEAGHLLFGLLTGYRFVSFRIANLMLIKKDGKFSLKKYSLAGTVGQCLMGVPDRADGKNPYALCNMGGVLMNLITAVIFFNISIIFADKGSFAVFFCSSLAVFGFAAALTNGIPLDFGIPNDGKNTLLLSKSPEARRALYIQFLINENDQNGVRLKDMPEELFAPPSAEGMQNSIIASLAVFRENRLMDELKFDDAARFIEILLTSDWAIVDLYKRFLELDKITCELICGEGKIDVLMTKTLKKFVKRMKHHPGVMRTEYAIALLLENDTAKAEKISERFEKTAKNYPYPSGIESEREIMNVIKQKSEQAI